METEMKFDPEKYEKAIPSCCCYQTLWEHLGPLLLCWGLLSSIQHDEPMDCGSCEFATRKESDHEK